MHATQYARHRWLSRTATSLKTQMTLTGELRQVVSSLQNDLTHHLGNNASHAVRHLNSYLVTLGEGTTGAYKLYLRMLQVELERLFPTDKVGIMAIQELLAVQARRQLHLRQASHLRRTAASASRPVYH